ncbi:MAG: metal ABC transporter ATP-binding protein [Candidatus Colwellbacteria bacterium]|nr:metal ABC transporter ATP-binding protein [Candidatus Colwellbacteria bacterium]
MHILDVKNLTVAFNGINVLENINFSVNEGDSFAIIGPNGSGKTVLFRALLNTLPYSGEINWDSHVKIGYVPQRLYIERDLPFTLGEFLKTKAKIFGISQKHIDELLDLVNLSKLDLARPLGKLSIGQFQRALITFALIGNPNVLLFDEPTASMDPAGEEQIYDTLHKLQDRKNLTVILVSHDINMVYKKANKVLCINKRQVCFGAPHATLTAENLEKIFGGHHKLYHHIHNGNIHTK